MTRKKKLATQGDFWAKNSSFFSSCLLPERIIIAIQFHKFEQAKQVGILFCIFIA